MAYYNYENCKSVVFKKEGVEILGKIRQNIKNNKELIILHKDLIKNIDADKLSVWACVDYLAETKELLQIVKRQNRQLFLYVITNEPNAKYTNYRDVYESDYMICYDYAYIKTYKNRKELYLKNTKHATIQDGELVFYSFPSSVRSFPVLVSFLKGEGIKNVQSIIDEFFIERDKKQKAINKKASEKAKEKRKEKLNDQKTTKIKTRKHLKCRSKIKSIAA